MQIVSKTLQIKIQMLGGNYNLLSETVQSPQDYVPQLCTTKCSNYLGRDCYK